MDYVRNILALMGFLVLVLLALQFVDRVTFSWTQTGADDSDAATSRSGLGVRTDWRSRCQYLESRYGGLTPRLDQSGRQICLGGN